MPKILDDYMPLAKAAKSPQNPHMPSLRTLQRRAAERNLDGLVYIHNKPFLHVPTYRAGLESRIHKNRGRR
jgi:hypothetical protein